MNNYERHKGDDLLSNDHRLKYKWRWVRSASEISEKDLKKWTHFQCSSCNVGNWELEAIQWGSCDDISYEATFRWGQGDTIKRKEGFCTRIEAQIGAEKMLDDWIREQHTKIVNNK
jgi:hypothetical protein